MHGQHCSMTARQGKLQSSLPSLQTQ